MKTKKTNKTIADCRDEISGIGQRNRAARNLRAEKEKEKAAEKKIFISSAKLFPKRVPLLIEVRESLTQAERDAVITKRMTASEHTNTFKDKKHV